jgi:predicted Zn-dependent protease
MRATFLMNLVGEFDEPMGEAMGDFVVEVWEGTLEDTDQELAYYFDNLSDSRKNADVVVRMADALLESEPENHVGRAVRAVVRKELGDIEGALDDAMKTWSAVRSRTDLEWFENNARYTIENEFLPDHVDAFLAALDEAEADGEDGDSIRDAKLTLLARAGDEERWRAAVDQALAEDPDDVVMLAQLRQVQLREGRRVDALETLERVVELEPDDIGRRRELLGTYKSLRNPEAALEQFRKLEELNEGEPDPLAGLGISVPMGGSMTIIQSGGQVIRIVGGVVVSGGDDEDVPTIEKVKVALEEGDHETARTTLRRLWRQFPVGEGSGGPFAGLYFRGWGVPNWIWPEDEDDSGEAEETPEEKEQARQRRRGGLATFSEDEPEPAPERRGAYEVLVEHDLGLAEVEAMLRTKDARALDTSQPLFEALLHARMLSGDTNAAREELLAAVRAGRAGKVDNALLIAFLDEDPERATADTEAILDDLLRTLSPEDAAGMRRLARVWARQGNTDLAVRLYEWVATRTTDTGFFVFDRQTGVSAYELVREVKETLEGEERERVIEAILRYADPGDYPWQRERYDTLAIDTWAELLGPAGALERCRAICEKAGDLSEGLRRGSAKKAAWLFSRAGEIDAALRCLEIGLCRLDPGELPSDMRWWFSPEYPGSLGHAEVRKLFPRETEDFPAAQEWYRAAAAALQVWLHEERVNEAPVLQALAVLCRRLAAGGDAETARDIAARLLLRDDLSATQLLWLVDAAREAGAEDLADSTERRLLDEGRLGVERVHEVVARAVEDEGPAAAVEIGAAAAEYTRHPELLAVLAEASAKLGDEGGAAAWREAKLASEAAAETLAEAEKEAREKVE